MPPTLSKGYGASRLCARFHFIQREQPCVRFSFPSTAVRPLKSPGALTLVGRRGDCDLRLEHKSVSKLHCMLVRTDGLLVLRDLGSTNGTRVNGTRVRRAVCSRTIS